jgi:hypothetical protein
MTDAPRATVRQSIGLSRSGATLPVDEPVAGVVFGGVTVAETVRPLRYFDVLKRSLRAA